MRKRAGHAPTWALVPLKSPGRAKSRLAAVLSPRQRRRLLLLLAERVVRSLQATPGIDQVAVVTASAELAAFAGELDAVPLLQAADEGMAEALAAAVRQLAPQNPGRVLMVAGDLPLVTASALGQVLAAADAPPGVVVVPDRHRSGTNALLCTPPQVLAPCFGASSFQRHLAAAAAAGIRARILELDALALDLDCAEDVEFLRRNGGLPPVLQPGFDSGAEGATAITLHRGLRVNR